MPMQTIAALPRLSATSLSELLLAHSSSNLDASTPPPTIAIIDVRDDDHIGGHIKHSIHAPSHTLDTKIPELVRRLQGKKTVIFHCALSQQRGPSAALKYMRERERLLGAGKDKVGEVLKKNKESEAEERDKDADGEWEWEGVDEERGEKKEQKVYVLDRGFVGWQEKYGEDARLTEGYRREIWKDGYWM